MDLLEWVQKKNKEYKPENIFLSPYCQKRILERGIEEDIIRSLLINNKDLLNVKSEKATFEGKEEERFKLYYSLSSKYTLVIIAVYMESVLKVINVIKTSKKMEKKWQKKISL
ncbi:hypothetical protein FJZ17_00390 [Candidatus Pacearchaeota archaeon]|nr:hypothetical protein [Candidatus Pacearchaeota archaeon]